ncbi:MAG: histidine kinase dimerization/phospho-acceptor domain-containing protein [Aeromicrobium sp.]
MKSEFVSAVSHELRTPLTSIRGALELLNDGETGDLSPIAGKMVATALRGSERLTRLISDIIDVERLEGDRSRCTSPTSRSAPSLRRRFPTFRAWPRSRASNWWSPEPPAGPAATQTAWCRSWSTWSATHQVLTTRRDRRDLRRAT